ncbi:MAG TPA: gamma-glutamyltransferase [candidate division Zixibacteria bacterium]|nr:gamma-glutamyltransferase [candidate division Zixibacteria bacterium]
MLSFRFIRRWKWLCVIVAVLSAVWCLTGCSGISVTTYYSRGALATAAPIATNVGMKVFAEGGNAFDVAVAVGFALAVVHPEAGNIGGGGFATIRDGKTGAVRTLDFRETAPMAATEMMFLGPDSSVVEGLSTVGAKASGVPGTVAGLHELWERYGTIPWENLVGIAAALADTGFVVDSGLAASFTDHKQQLSLYPATERIFVPSGETPNAGDRFVQSDLSRTLYIIAAGGTDGFYNGQIADSIVSTMSEYGGLITKEDLAAYTPVWREPIHFTFDSLDVYAPPPPSSGGIAIAQILKILEPFEFSGYSPKSAGYIHLFCEASRFAFADRSKYLGDPAFYEVPVKSLLDSSYLARRRDVIDMNHALPADQIRPGLIAGAESDQTTHFSVCDSSGNMVSLTYTLNTSFGSKLTVSGSGFLLNNEMDDFSVKPGVPNTYGLIGGEANKVEPGKRMLSSMSPTIILRKGKPFMAVGSPGGSKIITTVAEAIIDYTRFDLSPEATVALPRFHDQWIPDVLYLEKGGFDINVRQALIRYGYAVEDRDPYSDLQIVVFGGDGLMAGASDPRGRGSSGGF